MLIESHVGLRNPRKDKASRVVIYDNFGNAVATFLQIDERNIDVRVRGQPGFEDALKFLGIKQTVVSTVVKAKDLPVIQVE